MSDKKPATNKTWKKIKDSPFDSATELNQHIEKIKFEEWDRIIRANERHLALKSSDEGLGRIFSQGFKAKFKDKDDKTEHAVWVHLTEDDEVKIEIDSEFKSKDTNGTLEALVRSLSQSFVSGYMTTVGLKSDDSIPTDEKKKSKK
ncbi:MAG: hypothetical protein HUU57_10305 [Bdellovibrio sp.]|nr:hypothetical protein [Bdellovibrio sp.]